jgi:hypothetical protein
MQNVTQGAELRRDEHCAMVVRSIFRNLVGGTGDVDIGEHVHEIHLYGHDKRLIL